MSERKISRPWLAAGIALCFLVLLAGYVGAYYKTVDNAVVIQAGPHDGVYFSQFYHMADSNRVRRVTPRTARYSVHSFSIPAALFAPIHWVDRRIRPAVWEPHE